MEADLDPSLPLWRRAPRPRKPSPEHRRATLEDRVIARMLAPWLDRELADPELADPELVDPELAGQRGGRALSEAHAARAEQLTTDRTRRSVARMLDRLIERAENRKAPCADQVCEATPLITSITARLRSDEPLDPCGVARLKLLLGDRAGPCYGRNAPTALSAALRDASRLLDVRPLEPRPHQRPRTMRRARP